eukprot:GCRY01001844.1.p1 GENE.GCRY01001844.1~~GCRY01001844.1.p1  ORF type:complete len:363 (+),score=73.63 GCRY01001844.1:140-1228(+)
MNQNLRIVFMNGGEVVVQVNEETNATQVRDLVAEKIGLVEKKYFQIWIQDDERELEIPLGTDAKPLAVYNQLKKDSLLRKSKTKLNYCVVFRMTAVFMPKFERNVKDVVAIKLFQEEAEANVAKGLYLVSLEELPRLVALSLRLKDIDNQPLNSDKAENIIKKHPLTFIPKNTLKQKKTSFWVNTIMKEFESITQERKIIHLLYLQVVRRLPYYGAVFLKGTIRLKKNAFAECLVGVNNQGIFSFKDGVCKEFLFKESLISSAKASETSPLLLRVQDKKATAHAQVDPILFSFADREGNLVKSLVQANLNLLATFDNFISMEIQRERETERVRAVQTTDDDGDFSAMVPKEDPNMPPGVENN